jgi:alkanesulfonate monooxygenase SsuD/methylene tetrahydromethanopterin reductase-like flavin-dependent oxidoreductase (luciferase family)
MRVFHFSEQPYPPAWKPEFKSLRVDLPSRELDPRIMADLYERYIDEWELADRLGFNVMVNEHHASATCLSPTAIVTLSILARVTRRARILTLGYPIANRLDPVRVAEELAMVDVISRGRLEMGFVRGVPTEVPVAVRSAATQFDRFWEAHDLIMKALTSIDGPFHWQGEHFQYRNVNVWPRCYQQPHPPVWITGRSPVSVREIAEKNYVLGTFLSGYQTREIFDNYRRKREEMGMPKPGADRFSYLGLMAIAETRKEAERRAETMKKWLYSVSLVSEPFNQPPGYFSAADTARMLRTKGGLKGKTKDGKVVDSLRGSLSELIDAGIIFCGTPDDVYTQLSTFADGVGGLGNFLMMAHAADLSHEETVEQLNLFGKEVLPRLQTADTASGLKAA